MKLTESLKVHAVDENKNQAICGMVQYLKPSEIKDGFYLDVTCKSCQWILNKELTSRYQKKPIIEIYEESEGDKEEARRRRIDREFDTFY